MEILHVIARVNQGGTATWLNNLIKGLREMDQKVSLFAGYVQAGEKEVRNFAEIGGIHIPKMGRSVSVGNDLFSLFALRKMIKELNPDLVNTHTAKAGVIGRIAAYSLGAKRPKIVHTYHGHILYGYFGKFKVLIIICIERMLAKKTDLLIVAGEKVKNDLIAARIGDKNQYRVINPGIAKPKFVERESARKFLKLNDDKLTVGWMGRLVPIKQPKRVLDLDEEFPDVNFIIAGTGILEIELRKSKAQNIFFVGWVDPAMFWPAVDIALLTSENEAQPIVLIEAAMMGLPSIAENVGSVSEVVLDEKTGLLVKNESERISQLRRLVKNEEFRSDLGNRGRLYVEERFGVSRFISEHLEAYKEIL